MLNSTKGLQRLPCAYLGDFRSYCLKLVRVSYRCSWDQLFHISILRLLEIVALPLQIEITSLLVCLEVFMMHRWVIWRPECWFVYVWSLPRVKIGVQRLMTILNRGLWSVLRSIIVDFKPVRDCGLEFYLNILLTSFSLSEAQLLGIEMRFCWNWLSLSLDLVFPSLWLPLVSLICSTVILVLVLMIIDLIVSAL